MMKHLLWVFLFWLGSLGIAQAVEVPIRVLSSQELSQKINLNGNWRLKGPDGKEILVTVPGPWERYYKPKFMTHIGQGIYELELHLPPEAKGKYFKLYSKLVGGEHFSCSINGQEVGHNGFRPQSTSRVTQFSPFKIDTLKLHLSCDIQNSKLFTSGLIRPVYFGPADQIEQHYLREKMLSNLNIGIFIFLALFHFLLYAGYRQEIGLLWFALLSASLGFFGEFYHARNLEFFLTEVPVDVSSLITRLAMFMILPMFFLYTNALDPQPGKRPYLKPWLVKFVLWFNLFFILTLLLPIQLYTTFSVFWLLVSVVYLLYNIWLLNVFLPYPQTYLYAGSNLLFSLGMIHDNLNGAGILPNENISRYVMLLFCLLQAIFLSRRMQQNYQQTMQFQQELTEVNQNLESLVSSRTREINSKNQELQKLASFKDEMTRMIVHDLKTPLNTLINLPAQQIKLSEPSRQSFEAASYRILSLVEKMTHFKQIESPELSLNCGTHNLHSLADNVLISVKNWAESKKITLLNQIDADLMLKVDPELLERVLLNLCDNAIKHTPIRGQIVLASEITDAEVCFWVEDNGPGMTAQALALAFDKHQSFAHGQTAASSGLGLAFCRQVIAAHGGRISLQNGAQGGIKALMVLPRLNPVNRTWQTADIQRVFPVYLRLKHLEVYEVSDILAIITPVQTEPSLMIRGWLQALEQAVREVNQEAYGQLLAEITPFADRR